jgi:hypothetical protein
MNPGRPTAANQWNDADYDLKLKFQSMVFPKSIEFDTKSGTFGTGELSPLYRYMPALRETAMPISITAKTNQTNGPNSD